MSVELKYVHRTPQILPLCIVGFLPLLNKRLETISKLAVSHHKTLLTVSAKIDKVLFLIN